MDVVDLLPSLRQRNGTAPGKSGDRLKADLSTVSKGIERLVTLAAQCASEEDAPLARNLNTVLFDILAEIDEVDVHHPPPRELLVSVSDRVKIVQSALKLLLLKNKLGEIVDENAAYSARQGLDRPA